MERQILKACVFKTFERVNIPYCIFLHSLVTLKHIHTHALSTTHATCAYRTRTHVRTHVRAPSPSLCAPLSFILRLSSMWYSTWTLEKSLHSRMIRHDMTAWIVLVSEAERTNARHGWIEGEKKILVSNFITLSRNWLRSLYVFKTYIYIYVCCEVSQSQPAWQLGRMLTQQAFGVQC